MLPTQYSASLFEQQTQSHCVTVPLFCTMALFVPAMRSMWESAVMPKNERGGTDYDAKEGDVKLEPSLGNIKPICCIESTHH